MPIGTEPVDRGALPPLSRRRMGGEDDVPEKRTGLPDRLESRSHRKDETGWKAGPTDEGRRPAGKPVPQLQPVPHPGPVS